MLQFNEEFFKCEFRSDFWIEEEMKHVWAAEMEVLARIDRICSKHNIRYFADSGTLLGAVRHKGYIPWDDDIDIIMMREDYLRFTNIALKGLLSPMQIISVYNNEEWDESFVRIVNGTKIDFGGFHLKEWHGCPWIVGVDILPIDVIPDSKEEQEILFSLTDGLRAMKLAVLSGADKTEQFEREVKWMEDFCGITIDRDRTLTPQLMHLRDSIAMSYLGTRGRQVARLAATVEHQVYDADWFAEPKYLPFESMMLPVPEEYDKVLKVLFGDYRIPLRTGSMHDYPFYKEQKKMRFKL